MTLHFNRFCSEKYPFHMQSLQDSAPAEFFAESGKLCRIGKYAQNLAENDVFGLPTTYIVILKKIPNFASYFAPYPSQSFFIIND